MSPENWKLLCKYAREGFRHGEDMSNDIAIGDEFLIPVRVIAASHSYDPERGVWPAKRCTIVHRDIPDHEYEVCARALQLSTRVPKSKPVAKGDLVTMRDPAVWRVLATEGAWAWIERGSAQQLKLIGELSRVEKK